MIYYQNISCYDDDNNNNDKYYDTIWELNNSNSIVDIFINKRNYRILHTSFHSFKNYIIEYCNIRKDLLLCFDHYYLMKRFHGNSTTNANINYYYYYHFYKCYLQLILMLLL